MRPPYDRVTLSFVLVAVALFQSRWATPRSTIRSTSLSRQRTAPIMIRFVSLVCCFLLMMNASGQSAETTNPLSRRYLQNVQPPNSTTAIAPESSNVTAPVGTMPTEGNRQNSTTDPGPSLAQACQSAMEDQVYGTRNIFVVTYIFELETTSDPILESRSIQTKLIRYLLQALMLESGLCDDYLDGDRKLVEVLNGLLGVGSASHPTILSMNCQNSSDSMSCFRMMGSVVLYFDESISSINFKDIKDTVLPLIYNNEMDLSSDGVIFRPVDETDVVEGEQQPNTQGSVSDAAAPESEIAPRRQSRIGLVGIVCAMVFIFCFVVGLGYLILNKYFVVVRRPRDFISKDMGASDDVSSIGVTHVISPQSSNGSEQREQYSSNINRAIDTQVLLDDVSLDEEEANSPYHIRLESVSDTGDPDISAGDANNWQRKRYVRRQRDLNIPRRKGSQHGCMPNTVEL